MLQGRHPQTMNSCKFPSQLEFPRRLLMENVLLDLSEWIEYPRSPSNLAGRSSSSFPGESCSLALMVYWEDNSREHASVASRFAISHGVFSVIKNASLRNLSFLFCCETVSKR